jgi:hypothetical protein
LIFDIQEDKIIGLLEQDVTLILLEDNCFRELGGVLGGSTNDDRVVGATTQSQIIFYVLKTHKSYYLFILLTNIDI